MNLSSKDILQYVDMEEQRNTEIYAILAEYGNDIVTALEEAWWQGYCAGVKRTGELFGLEE